MTPFTLLLFAFLLPAALVVATYAWCIGFGVVNGVAPKRRKGFRIALSCLALAMICVFVVCKWGLV